ncbi:MAG: ComF family protein [Acidobacteriales bacterium]|nr:ComF family protein [Terriglobales bacterium]
MDAYPLDEHDLCTVCRESMANFDTAYSFGSYEGPLQKLIHLFKYGKVETLAAPLSRLLWSALPAGGAKADLVIAMPMHWRKKWDRGFNQAELLAKPIAARLGVRLNQSLRRKRHTRAQAGLSERQRQQNLQDAFAVKRRHEIAGKRILLIDDVFTTGASLRAAARTLKLAGAARVEALTLARVDRRALREIPAATGKPSYEPVGCGVT